MNLDKAKKQFDKLILQSLENTQYIIPNTVYYNESYHAQLVKELKKRNLFKNLQDKELQEVAPGLIKMCSVASSSRLCFINFANKNEIIFERPLSTGKGTARLDASKDNLFYECKCHEIFDKHNDYLSLSYIENLKDFFNINYQKTDTNYCKLNLTDFGIENKESIYSLHFDMKQLLCHLFGIARNGGGTLQYIFFTPKKELIENNEFCRNMYKELENEIAQIWHCEKITMMINNFKIKLPHPQMIDVSSIEDVVLKTWNYNFLFFNILAGIIKNTFTAIQFMLICEANTCYIKIYAHNIFTILAEGLKDIQEGRVQPFEEAMSDIKQGLGI